MFKLFGNLMDKDDNHDGLKLNAMEIALMGVFFGALMVATFHCIFNTCKYGANTRRRHPPNSRQRAAAVVTSESMATVAVPVSRYSKECNEDMCSVCLSEFKEGEEIRVLPECFHVYHVDCIDMWLISHSNCPLCRATTASVSVASQQNHDVVVRIETDHD